MSIRINVEATETEFSTANVSVSVETEFMLPRYEFFHQE